MWIWLSTPFAIPSGFRLLQIPTTDALRRKTKRPAQPFIRSRVWLDRSSPGGNIGAVQQEVALLAQPIIHSDPEIQGGVPVFYGTRVPVKNLFGYLEAGDSLDQFLHSFPSVSREQAVAALEMARGSK